MRPSFYPLLPGVARRTLNYKDQGGFSCDGGSGPVARGHGAGDGGGPSLSRPACQIHAGRTARRGTDEAVIYGDWDGATWQSSVGAKGSAVTAWQNWRVNDTS
jgi:hypothetical protein